jgi:hypothetical protein
MTRQWARWPRMALVLVCLAAIANVRMISHALRHRDVPKPGEIGPFVARFEPLRPMLPEGSVTGFVLDREHAAPHPPHPEARFALAQYALCPRVVEELPLHELVIVDSDAPATPPAVARQCGWDLVADLGNGVRLYRTRGGR